MRRGVEHLLPIPWVLKPRGLFVFRRRVLQLIPEVGRELPRVVVHFLGSFQEPGGVRAGHNAGLAVRKGDLQVAHAVKRPVGWETWTRRRTQKKHAVKKTRMGGWYIHHADAH